MVKIMVEKSIVRFIRHPAVSRPARESYTFRFVLGHMSIGLARHRRKPNVYESWASSFAFTRRFRSVLRFHPAREHRRRHRSRSACFRSKMRCKPFYARDRDFFSAAGLTADVQILPRKQCDAAGIVPERSMSATAQSTCSPTLHSKSIPVTVIAPGASIARGPIRMLRPSWCRPKSTVKTAKDLNGKIIGANSLHSLADAVPKLWVDQNGGDSSTLKFVEMPSPPCPPAFEAGRIDGAFISEPFLGVASKSGRVLAYGYDCIAKHFLLGAYFTTPQWAKDHPDVIARFRAGMKKAAGWADEKFTPERLAALKLYQARPGVRCVDDALRSSRSHSRLR